MKKSRNLWLFIFGRFISLTGSGIQTIAIPLYILDITKSGTMMGVFSAVILIPILFTAPFSGIIGDRKNRKSIMIGTDLGRGILIGFAGIIVAAGSFNIYILFCLQIFISVMDSLFNSASAALMPELISKEELIEANALKGGTDAASAVLGPALGGLTYGIFGIKMVFYINAVSFLISAIASLFLRYRGHTSDKEKIDLKMFLNGNHEAIKFIVNKKGLLELFCFAMLSNFFLAPLFDIVIPYVLKKEVGFSSQQYGSIMGSLSVGVLLGNAGISVYFKKLGIKKLMKTGFIIETTLRVVVCGLLFPKVVSIYGGAGWKLFISLLICCIAMEFFNAFVNTSISTNFQNLVPDKMRARFFSILGMFSQGAIPLGSLLFGILLDRVKYYIILIVINMVMITVLAVFLTNASNGAYEAKAEEI